MPWWAWSLVALGVVLLLYVAFVAFLVVAGRREDARALAGFIPDCAVLMARLLRDDRVPRRYKLLFVGLLLGLTSLFLMHGVARRLIGAVNAWAFVVGVLALSSFGIYLGRVQRWNSWDVFVRPGSLLGQIGSGLLDPLNHPRPIALTVLLTSFLLATYLVFYSLAR